MTDTLTNGSRRHEVERLARQAVAEGRKPNGSEIARQLGMSARTATHWIGKMDRNGAADAVPVVVADVPGEAPRPARTKTTAAKRKVADRHIVDWLIIGVVTAVAAIWSYSHIVDLAIDAGHGWRSYLLPLAIDGLLVAGVRAVGRDRRYPIAWIAITVGVVGTVAGNVLAVRPELVDLADVAAVSAGFPAIALPTIVHLVRR